MNIGVTITRWDWEWIETLGAPLVSPGREIWTSFWWNLPYNVSHLKLVMVCQGSTAENMERSVNKFIHTLTKYYHY